MIQPGVITLTRMRCSPSSRGEAAREADHRRLRGGVHRHVAALGAVGIRTEVDDRSAAHLLHAGHHGLDREERRALVHRDARVVVLRRHVHEVMAVVVGHVINEYVEVAQRAGRVADGRLQRRDIGDIRLAIPGARTIPPSRSFCTSACEGASAISTKATSAPCLANASVMTSADARATAGDENTAAAQGRVTGAAIGAAGESRRSTDIAKGLVRSRCERR